MNAESFLKSSYGRKLKPTSSLTLSHFPTSRRQKLRWPRWLNFTFLDVKTYVFHRQYVNIQDKYACFSRSLIFMKIGNFLLSTDNLSPSILSSSNFYHKIWLNLLEGLFDWKMYQMQKWIDYEGITGNFQERFLDLINFVHVSHN